MLTWSYRRPTQITKDGPTEMYGQGDCLSTDVKPTTGISNGSVLHEMDTSKNYKFDAENGLWREIVSSGGGSDIVFATPEEVEEALENG